MIRFDTIIEFGTLYRYKSNIEENMRKKKINSFSTILSTSNVDVLAILSQVNELVNNI